MTTTRSRPCQIMTQAAGTEGQPAVPPATRDPGTRCADAGRWLQGRLWRNDSWPSLSPLSVEMFRVLNKFPSSFSKLPLPPQAPNWKVTQVGRGSPGLRQGCLHGSSAPLPYVYSFTVPTLLSSLFPLSLGLCLMAPGTSHSIQQHSRCLCCP